MAKTFVARVQVLGLGPEGQETCNTFEYSTTSTTIHAEDAQSVAEAFEGEMGDPYRACIVAAWAWYLTRVEVFQYQTDNVARFEFESFDLAGAVGTSAGTCVSIERAVILQKQTSLAGRRFRGRVFLPMPRSDVADLNGNLNPAFVSAFDVLGGAMLTPFDSIGGTWVPGVGHHGVDVTCTDLTGYGINALIGIQKRRRVRLLT